jgi:pimeloyl-ACP methyl ester carboxylesterase
MLKVAAMFANVQGAKIHYSDSGEGVPTLFLHGIPDSGSVWNEVVKGVRGGYRCLVPDLPGFGQSQAPAGFKVGLMDMAEFIDGFLTAIGITEPVNLVVHDIGGPYGLAWAVRHPERVRSITIMNTVFQAEYHWHRYGRICRTPILGELLQLLTTQSGLARAMRANSGMRKPGREHIAATYRSFTAPVRKMVLQLYRGLDPDVFRVWDEELRALTARIPTLVLWGDQDTYIASSYAERFGARKVKHCPTSGHWLMVEVPAAVTDNLLEHFASTDALLKRA